MRAFTNAAHQAASQQREALAVNRPGIVRNYDPSTYAVKVEFDGLLTQWIPLKALAVGNGFGILAAPGVGDMVDVHFLDGSIECATVGMRFFGDGAVPPSVASGEFLIRHQSGSLLKFAADGSVQLVTAGALTATVNGNANLSVAGDLVLQVAGKILSQAAEWVHTGLLRVVGAIQASGDITDSTAAGNSRTVGGTRAIFNTHTHPETGDGGGTTLQPNQQM